MKKIMAIIGIMMIIGSSMTNGHAALVSGVDMGGNTEEKPLMVIMGASYAQDWKISELAGHKILNKGVHGEQTDQMLERFDKDVIQNKPKTVLLWGFINDIARADKSKINDVLTNVKNNIKRMVEIAGNNGIEVILATEVTIRGGKSIKDEIINFIGGMLGKKGYKHYANDNVLKINDWLEKYANENNITILDFQKITSKDNGERIRKYAQEDGSHITEEAYKELTRYSREMLDN